MTDGRFWWNVLLAAPIYIPAIMLGLWLGERTGAIRRYFYGWFMWGRAIWIARTKRRGAGPMKWEYAFKLAGQYRWLVDGQMRGSKGPRWMRKALTSHKRGDLTQETRNEIRGHSNRNSLPDYASTSKTLQTQPYHVW